MTTVLFWSIWLGVFVLCVLFDNCIHAPFTSQATEHITIKNDSEQTIAFKVKTTAPKVYCVRPNAALVAAGETVDVQVIFLGLKEEPKPGFKCKDKFLVIALPAPYELGDLSVAEAWPQLEAEFKNKGLSKKIKVNYLLDAEQTAPQTEAVQTEVVPPVNKGSVATGSKATEETTSEPVQKRAAAAPASVPASEAPVSGSTGATVASDDKPKANVASSEKKTDEKAGSSTTAPAPSKDVSQSTATSSIVPAVIIWVVIGFLLWYWLS